MAAPTFLSSTNPRSSADPIFQGLRARRQQRLRLRQLRHDQQESVVSRRASLRSGGGLPNGISWPGAQSPALSILEYLGQFWRKRRQWQCDGRRTSASWARDERVQPRTEFERVRSQGAGRLGAWHAEEDAQNFVVRRKMDVDNLTALSPPPSSPSSGGRPPPGLASAASVLRLI